MDLMRICDSVIANMIAMGLCWFIHTIWKAMGSWARNREKSLSQYLIEISYSLPVIIWAAFLGLLFSLLRFALISSDPIMWSDTEISFGYFVCVILLITASALTVLLFSPPAPQGKDRRALIGVIIMTVTTAAFAGGLSRQLEKERDKLLSTSEVGEQATINDSSSRTMLTPALSFGTATITDQSYTQNTAIPSLALPAAGGGTEPLIYSLNLALPAGLNFNQSTRVLSGTPISTLTTTTYTYTVTDATGTTAALSFNLTVALPATPANKIGMEFVLIPAGTFHMGSPVSMPGQNGEEAPLHQVTISRPFYLGKYEVTQEQWRKVMRTDPPGFSCNACPVVMVSWDDVMGFVEELNSQEGTKKYRLPTEAEWEYAARAGTLTRYHFGNAENRLGRYAWYGENENANKSPETIGQKKKNAFGLYDIHGNVWEWVHDWYGVYPYDAVTDPRGPPTGADRVLRGGSWISPARNCRVAHRNRQPPDRREINYGFRLAKTP